MGEYEIQDLTKTLYITVFASLRERNGAPIGKINCHFIDVGDRRVSNTESIVIRRRTVEIQKFDALFLSAYQGDCDSNVGAASGNWMPLVCSISGGPKVSRSFNMLRNRFSACESLRISFRFW